LLAAASAGAEANGGAAHHRMRFKNYDEMNAWLTDPSLKGAKLGAD